MGFYEDFIEKYDKLISWEDRFEREANFYKTLFKKYKVNKILDCACGTGQHVIMFNQMGFSAIGSDVSSAMVKKAKDNARKYHVKGDIKTADFRNLSKTITERFDCVICVGNSLPHLFSNKDINKALREMYKVLKKNGLLILQQRNYDMLVGKKMHFIPISIRSREIFFYVLDYFHDKVVFNVIDIQTKSGKFNVYNTEYNPIKKSNITKLLRNNGFRNLKFYKNYKFKGFDIKRSENLIVTCTK